MMTASRFLDVIVGVVSRHTPRDPVAEVGAHPGSGPGWALARPCQGQMDHSHPPVVEREEHIVLIGACAEGRRADPVQGVTRAQLGDELSDERGGVLLRHGSPGLQPVHADLLTPRPWWSSGACVETSP